MAWNSISPGIPSQEPSPVKTSVWNLALPLSAVLGCGPAPATQCRDHSDCNSGICQDGECADADYYDPCASECSTSYVPTTGQPDLCTTDLNCEDSEICVDNSCQPLDIPPVCEEASALQSIPLPQGVNDETRALQFVDVDGDPALELVSFHIGVSDTFLRIVRGPGTEEPAIVPIEGSPSPTAMAAADVDGDGSQDIVVATGDEDVRMYSLLNDGAGSFTEVSGLLAGDWIRRMAAGDFDGDGAMDLVVTERETYYLLGDGSGSFAPGGVLPSVSFVSSMVSGRFDADAASDLIIHNDGETELFLGGDVIDVGRTLSEPAPGGTRDLATADLDADGILDLVGVSIIHPGSLIAMWQGLGDATFPDVRLFADPLRYETLAVGDVDGDGLDDVVLGGEANITVWFSSGGQDVVRCRASYETAHAADGLAVGDFTGDGRDDIAIATTSLMTVLSPGG